ncbi:hypothetical protein CJ030_MR3G009501 [Morella rubra]|uniref:Uncharacterized protein n=1 Tax=Morella rubra TaxID=262757 RepID=A0A6A1W3M9_9ROSI|nr:hypothetical protein CJ030_MR3G009501 [Morella rubra]
MTKRFTIPEPPLGDIVKSWFLKDLGEKWRNYKCSLKQIFDEAFTPQYVKNNAPTDVNLEQFCKLVDFWYSDAGRHRSHAGKQNRSLQTTVHTAGSKSFARYAHELANGGDWTERFRKFTNFHEFRVDGSIGWSPSDRYAQVIGPERHGRIRGVGLGPTPSSHPANTNEQRQYQDVPNNNQVSPAIHRSSHASRKTSVADNADDAESAGADGAEEANEEIGLNDSGSSQTSNEFRVDGSISWSPSDRYAQVIGPERHGRIRGVGLGPTPSSHPANTNDQRQYQDVANNNHVSPAIHRSSHASWKTSVADNVDDAKSVGADGAEGGED